jgi:hypothetical protein
MLLTALVSASIGSPLATGLISKQDYSLQFRWKTEPSYARLNRFEEWTLLLDALQACRAQGFPRRWSSSAPPKWLLSSAIRPLRDYQANKSERERIPSPEAFLAEYFQATNRELRSATDSERRWDLRGARPEIVLTTRSGARKIAISADGKFIEYEVLLFSNGERWICDPSSKSFKSHLRALDRGSPALRSSSDLP